MLLYCSLTCRFLLSLLLRYRIQIVLFGLIKIINFHAMFKISVFFLEILSLPFHYILLII